MKDDNTKTPINWNSISVINTLEDEYNNYG